MAKTRRRRRSSVSSAQPRSYSDLYKESATSALPEQAVVQTNANTGSGKRDSDAVDWTNEYAYVLKDLRSLIAISAALFALMIVIGLVI